MSYDPIPSRVQRAVLWGSLKACVSSVKLTKFRCHVSKHPNLCSYSTLCVCGCGCTVSAQYSKRIKAKSVPLRDNGPRLASRYEVNNTTIVN